MKLNKLAITILFIIVGITSVYAGGMMLLRVGDANGNGAITQTGSALLVDNSSPALLIDNTSPACLAGGC